MKWIAVFLVKVYHRILSPILPRACRFRPTCSEYMIDALNEYGFFKGMAKGIWRVLRCNPFGGSGYDPAVPRTTEKDL